MKVGRDRQADAACVRAAREAIGEQLLFAGALEPIAGELRPDLSRPGFGLELKHVEAARYAA